MVASISPSWAGLLYKSIPAGIFAGSVICVKAVQAACETSGYAEVAKPIAYGTAFIACFVAYCAWQIIDPQKTISPLANPSPGTQAARVQGAYAGVRKPD